MDGIKKLALMAIILLPLLGIFACNADKVDLPNVEDCETYNYQDCNTVQAFEAEMTINFSISSRIKSVAFEVYKGYVDDNNLYFQDTAYSANKKYLMPVNEYWSVKAIYNIEGQNITVIDGGSLKAYSKKVCDSTCWAVNKLSLEVVIK